MHRELNRPDEIIRRLLFVVYLISWVTTILLAVIGLVNGRFSLLALSIMLFSGCLVFKQYGEHSLQFKRLARSFPFGEPADELPMDLRQRLENLFAEFHATQKDWQKRQELRHELAALLKKNPEISKIYPREIASIHPA